MSALLLCEMLLSVRVLLGRNATIAKCCLFYRRSSVSCVFVCLCACVSLLVTFMSPQKRLNQSRCRLGWWIERAQGTIYYIGVQIPKEGAVLGVARPNTCKMHCESLLRCTQQKANNGISKTAAADCSAPDWPNLAIRARSEFFDHMMLFVPFYMHLLM